MNVRVVTSIRQIEPWVWDRLCDGVVFSHGWFSVLEDSGAAQADPRHLVLEEEGRVVGIVPCFIQRGDPYYSLDQRLFGPFRPLAKRLGGRVLPALLAYSPVAHRSGIFLAEGVDRPAAIRACAEAMARICRAERLPVSGWLFASRWDRELMRTLRRTGHAEAFLCPSAYWASRFDNFEDYVESFKQISRHHYKTVRHELNRSDRAGIEVADAPLSSLDDQQLATMFGVLYQRYYPRRRNPFQASFFAALKRHLGERARVHTAARNGQLVSYSIVLQGPTRWHMFLSGDADGQQAHADRLHFRLNYYFPMQQAIATGALLLDYGLSAYGMKIQRGCLLEPLSVAVRAHRAPLSWWLPLWMELVNLWHAWRYRMYAQANVTTPATLGRPPLGSLGQRLRRWLIANRESVLVILPTRVVPATPQPPAGVTVTVRRLRADELPLLRPLADRWRWVDIRQFQRDGYRCYGIWAGPRLVGYYWIACGESFQTAFFGKIALQRDEVFGAYIYVEPQWRGHGIHIYVKHVLAAQFAREGFRLFWTAVTVDNHAALKSEARLGAWCSALLRYRRIGPWVRRAIVPIPSDHPVRALFRERRTSMGLSAEPDWQVADAERRWWMMRSKPWWRRQLAKHVKLSKQTFLLTGLWTGAPVPVPSNAPALSVRRLAADELPGLRATVDTEHWALFERFHQAGYHCYGGWAGEALAGYMWVNEGRPQMSQYFGTIPLRANEAFSGFVYASPQFRGRGVPCALKRDVAALLAARGITVIYGGIVSTNVASLKSSAATGAHPLQMWGHWRVGPVSWRKALGLPSNHTVMKIFAERQRQLALPQQPPAALASVGAEWRNGRAEALQRSARPVMSASGRPPGGPRRGRLARVRELIREHGWATLIRLAAARARTLVWEQSTILESTMPLEAGHSDWGPRLRLPITVERLAPHDLPRLRAVMTASAYRFFRRYADQGYVCYIGTVRGEIVAYNWYTTTPYRSPMTRILFPVPPGHVFLIYSHTLPAWRAKGVDFAMKARAFEDFRLAGCHRVRTTVDHINHVSLRQLARWNSTVERLYHYRRILWWRSVRVSSMQEARDLVAELSRDHIQRHHRVSHVRT
jgi:hypothetical protein